MSERIGELQEEVSEAETVAVELRDAVERGDVFDIARLDELQMHLAEALVLVGAVRQEQGSFDE